jgi:GMP reductase
MRISEDIKLDFSDVLLVPQRSELRSRADVDILRMYRFKHSNHLMTSSGIIAANMDSVGTFDMAKALTPYHGMVALHKFYSIEKLKEFFNDNLQLQTKVFYSLGPNDDDFTKLVNLCKVLQTISGFEYTHPLLLNLDAANGYTENFIKYLECLREYYPKAVIMAGNVVSPNMTEELILKGADIVKVGIGPGSVCLTRKVAGVGYPQLSAIDECSFAAHGVGGHICGDGGITCEGDVSKAFCAGADFVMIGGMLSGTDECEGTWEYEYVIEPTVGTKSEVYTPLPIKELKKYFKYHGMSSKEAMEQHYGGMSDYRASEGKEVKIPHKGSAVDIFKSIQGGIRSTCSYIGARRLKDMPKCAQFVRVNRQLNNVYGG